MKLIAIFLSIHILVLTVAPSLSAVFPVKKTEHCCKMKCCMKHKTKSGKQDTENKNCCDNGLCNPLVNCYCCCALPASYSELSPSLKSLSRTFFPITEITTSGFMADAWHPPKFV